MEIGPALPSPVCAGATPIAPSGYSSTFLSMKMPFGKLWSTGLRAWGLLGKVSDNPWEHRAVSDLEVGELSLPCVKKLNQEMGHGKPMVS